MSDLKARYRHQFLPTWDPGWFEAYIEKVIMLRNVSLKVFRSQSFQRDLWELTTFGIGQGELVRIEGAYDDPQVVDALWQLRSEPLPSATRARAKYLGDAFTRILAIVTPRYNARRPMARLVRIFAIMFPADILCLMDARRTFRVSQWLHISPPVANFIEQQVLIRAELREQLGSEADLAEQVNYSLFTWYIWAVIVPTETGDEYAESAGFGTAGQTAAKPEPVERD